MGTDIRKNLKKYLSLIFWILGLILEISIKDLFFIDMSFSNKKLGYVSQKLPLLVTYSSFGVKKGLNINYTNHNEQYN